MGRARSGKARRGAAQEEEARAAQAAALGYDLAGVAEALQAYAEGQGAAGDAVLASKDPTVRAAVEWTFVRLHPGEAGLGRIAAFMRAHPDWPTALLRKRAEEMAGAEGAKPDRVAAYFARISADVSRRRRSFTPKCCAMIRRAPPRPTRSRANSGATTT